MTSNTVDTDIGFRRIKGREPRTQSQIEDAIEYNYIDAYGTDDTKYGSSGLILLFGHVCCPKRMRHVQFLHE